MFFGFFFVQCDWGPNLGESCPYVPLKVHSSYSLLEGCLSIKKILALGKDRGWSSVGLADTGHLFGAMEFSLGAAQQSIKPLLGCKLFFCPEFGEEIPSYPLVLYAATERGYKNLCTLVSATTVEWVAASIGSSWQDSLGRNFQRGVLSLSQIKNSSLTEGVLILSGGHQGPVSHNLIHHKEDCLAWKYCDLLSDIFPDRFFIEVERYGYSYEKELEERLLPLAWKKGIPILGCQEAFFPDTRYFQAHEALLSIGDGTYLSQENRRFLTKNHDFKSSEEMKKLFEDMPGALDNTRYFAEKINFILRGKSPSIPRFLGLKDSCLEKVNKSFHESSFSIFSKDREILGESFQEDDLLFLRKSREGLDHRLTHYIFPSLDFEAHTRKEKEYRERLEYECAMIIKMGFAGYFLIVSDFISWAKQNGIAVGPGRGSGASSLVAWSLLITDVDPIGYQLLFERFLNPARVSMPDFDVDFCQERRDEVISYVRDKYGFQCVAHIITFGSFQARGVLRDVGRVLQMPYSQVDRLCKLIPHNPVSPVNLEEALAIEPQLNQALQSDEQVEKLFEIGKKLEGLYRHSSTHAAGVVISDGPLIDRVPLYQDPRSILPATEFSMKYVESAGLIKFDFLGLKTLTVLAKAVKLVNNRGIDVDLLKIPLDDPVTFDLLRRVETLGVFQLESSGMSSVLKQLRPERFEELIALVALYRPGPMDDIPRYIACRHGYEKVHYAYPCLEEILKETFGVMVYQEQVLQIARILAGYNLGAADLLRRAMAKKIPSEMDAQREIFVKGAVENYGGPEEKASQLFDQIAKFAGYAFPKAHATPYALISYQTAYMKANFPVEFMTELLNCDLNNTDEIAIMMEEIKRMKIAVLPPDVNHSCSVFVVEKIDGEKSAIRYGLGALKNVGRGLMEDLENHRKKEGKFQSIYDFFERMMGYNMSKRQIESLIMAGAFDSLWCGRKTLLDHMSLLMNHGSMGKSSEDMGLFSVESLRPHLENSGEWSYLETLGYEFQAFGFYSHRHPLDHYKDLLSAKGVIFSHELLECLSSGKGTKKLLMCGVLTSFQEKTTKDKKKLSIVKMSDPFGMYDITLFGGDRERSLDRMIVGQPYVVSLNSRVDQDQVRLACSNLENIQALLEEWKIPVILWVYSLKDLDTLKKDLDQMEEGKTSVILKIHGEAQGVGFNDGDRMNPEKKKNISWVAQGKLKKAYGFSFEKRSFFQEKYKERS